MLSLRNQAMSKVMPKQSLVHCTNLFTENYREEYKTLFEGKSLLEIKIEQICRAVPAECVYVSSNGDQVLDLCRRMGANFIKRPTGLLGNNILQKDLFRHFLSETPVSETVAWIQVTDPLFDNFEELFSVILEG